MWMMGQDIVGEKDSDLTGWLLGISSGGTTIVIGAPNNINDNGYASGHVCVYQYSTQNQQWIQKGGDIDGVSKYDQSGRALSMSRDAAVLAIGAWRNNGNNRYDSGHVRVYVYDKDKQKWTQQGPDLDGEAADDRSGQVVALLDDGSTVAIGAPKNNGNGSRAGHVRIFRFDRTNNNWVQIGGDIDGEAEGDRSGQSVDISDNGTTVVIGAYFNDGAGQKAGHARVFRYDTLDGDWVQQGTDLDGKAGNRFGWDASISADGTVVGATGFNTNNLEIPKWTSCTTPPPSSMPSVTPNVSIHRTTPHIPHHDDSTAYAITNSPFVRTHFNLSQSICSAPMETTHSDLT